MGQNNASNSVRNSTTNRRLMFTNHRQRLSSFLLVFGGMLNILESVKRSRTCVLTGSRRTAAKTIMANR